MKGVFIFNHMDDIAFMSTDEEYSNHLKKCARDQGFIEVSDNWSIEFFDATTQTCQNQNVNLFDQIITHCSNLLNKCGIKPLEEDRRHFSTIQGSQSHANIDE